MPRFNGINTDRLESFARKLLGIRQGGIVPTLSPEPNLSLNVPYQPDQDALSGAWPFGMGITQAAVAGQLSWFHIVNLSSLANPVLLLVRPRAAPSANSQVLISVGTPDTGPLGGVALNPTDMAWRDTRRPATSFPAGGATVLAEIGTGAALPGPVVWHTVARLTSLAQTMCEGPWIILAPQTGLLISNSVVNASLHATIEGFYRADVLPDELEG